MTSVLYLDLTFKERCEKYMWCVKKWSQRYMDETLLRLYGHVACMADDRLVKEIYVSVTAGSGKCRPRKMNRCSELLRAKGF